MTFKRFTGNPKVLPLSANNLVSFDIDADEEIIGPHLPFPFSILAFSFGFRFGPGLGSGDGFCCANETFSIWDDLSIALSVAKRVNLAENV